MYRIKRIWIFVIILFFIGELHADVFVLPPVQNKNEVSSSGDFVDSHDNQRVIFRITTNHKLKRSAVQFDGKQASESMQLGFNVTSSFPSRAKKFSQMIRVDIAGGEKLNLSVDGKTVILKTNGMAYSKIYHFGDEDVKHNFNLKIELNNHHVNISFLPFYYYDQKTNEPISDPFTYEIEAGKMILGDVIKCSIPLLIDRKNEGKAFFHLDKQQKTVIFGEKKQERKLLEISLTPINLKSHHCFSVDGSSYYENLQISLDTILSEQKKVDGKWITQDRKFYGHQVLRLYPDMKMMLLGASLNKVLNSKPENHQYHLKREALSGVKAWPFYRGRVITQKDKYATVHGYSGGSLQFRFVNQTSSNCIKIFWDAIIIDKQQYKIKPVSFSIDYKKLIW